MFLHLLAGEGVWGRGRHLSPLPHQPYRNLPAVLFVLKELGDDIHRNWGVQERIVAWNPFRMWKTFTFFVAAFLAYHQGVWLSLFFIAFAIGSAIKKMLLNVSPQLLTNPVPASLTIAA